MRIASRILALAAAALALSAGAPAQAQQPIRIGVLLPLTGPFAKNGIENWEAMQIARDMINERGGVNGRKIEYLHGDATSPNAAISETERLITKDGIKITTGSFASPLAIAVSQAAERHGVFHWETTGRRRNHHPARLQAHVPGRRAGAAIQPGGGRFRHRRSGRSSSNKPVGDLRIALLWENRAFGKSVGDGVRAYTEEQEDQAGLRRRLRPVRHRHDADRAEAQGRQARRPDRDLVSERRHPVPAQGQGARLQRRRLHRRERRLLLAGSAQFDRRSGRTASSSPTSRRR